MAHFISFHPLILRLPLMEYLLCARQSLSIFYILCNFPSRLLTSLFTFNRRKKPWNLEEERSFLPKATQLVILVRLKSSWMNYHVPVSPLDWGCLVEELALSSTAVKSVPATCPNVSYLAPEFQNNNSADHLKISSPKLPGLIYIWSQPFRVSRPSYS